EKFADVKEPDKEEMLPAPTPVAQPEPTAAAPAEISDAKGRGETSAAGASGSSQVIEVTLAHMGLRQMPGNTPPDYARELRRKRVQGRGQLVYYVTRDGRVTNIQLTKSTGSPELDQSAISAFSKYKFYPGQEGYTVHDFEFSLQG